MLRGTKACMLTWYRYQDGVLTSTAYEGAAGTREVAAGAPFKTDVMVERLVVLGLPGGPRGWQVRAPPHSP